MPKKGTPEFPQPKHLRTRAIPFKPEAVVGTFPVVTELVDEIENLLAQAKSGHLRAAAWAVVYHDGAKPDGEIASGWARGPYTAFGLTAAVERLVYRWRESEYKS